MEVSGQSSLVWVQNKISQSKGRI